MTSMADFAAQLTPAIHRAAAQYRPPTPQTASMLSYARALTPTIHRAAAQYRPPTPPAGSMLSRAAAHPRRTTTPPSSAKTSPTTARNPFSSVSVSEIALPPRDGVPSYARTVTAPDGTVIPLPTQPAGRSIVQHDAKISVSGSPRTGYNVTIINGGGRAPLWTTGTVSAANKTAQTAVKQIAGSNPLRAPSVARGIAAGAFTAGRLAAAGVGGIAAALLTPSPLGTERFIDRRLDNGSRVRFTIID